MGKINWGRVVVGGLLAGLVLNIVDFTFFGVMMKQDIAAAMQALGKPPGAMDRLVPLFVVLDFVTGIGLLWVYAAIRPRFGAGATTAVIAGVAVWFFVGLLHALGEAPMGLFPQKMYTVGTVVALVEYAVAGAVGAYVYKEM
jgi:hypothetical protein